MVQLATFVQQSNVSPLRQVGMSYFLLILFVKMILNIAMMITIMLKRNYGSMEFETLFLFSLPVLILFSLD